MNFQKYRFADVTMFCLLAFLASLMSEFFYDKLNNSLVYLNFGLLISAILIVRWGVIGAVAFALSGIPVLIFRSGDSSISYQILFYVISNLAIGVSIFSFKFIDRNKIRSNFGYALIFLSSIFLSVSIVKGIVLSLYGDNLFISIYSYFLAEAFNMVITILAFLLISKLSSELIVDMKHYIMTVQKEGTDRG